MKRILLAATLVLLGVGACAPVKGSPPACRLPTPQEMVVEVNEDRAAHGLQRVELGGYLTHMAQTWADHMVAAHRVYHSPASYRAYKHPGGGTFFASENVLGRFKCLDAAQIEAAWMASTGHRDNILDPTWETVGVGVVIDAQARVWAVQEFGI